MGRDAAVWGECRIETDKNELYAERFRLEFDLHKAEFFRRRLAQRLADVRYFTHQAGAATAKTLFDLPSTVSTLRTVEASQQ